MRLGISTKWLLFFLCIGIGHGLADWLVSAYDYRLQINGVYAAIWLLVISPLIETWVFNLVLQQALQHYVMRKLRHEYGSQLLALGFMSIMFVLAHTYAVGLNAIYWLVPALVLGVLWIITQSWLMVAAVHACWNASMAWFSL